MFGMEYRFESPRSTVAGVRGLRGQPSPVPPSHQTSHILLPGGRYGIHFVSAFPVAPLPMS